MRTTTIDPQPRAYSQGVLVTDATQLLFVSGQTPQDANGDVAGTFDAQCRQAWQNVVSILNDAGMSIRNLIKVTIHLSDRQNREANARIRHEILDDHSPALTVLITGIYDDSWLLEIEAVAAA